MRNIVVGASSEARSFVCLSKLAYCQMWLGAEETAFKEIGCKRSEIDVCAWTFGIRLYRIYTVLACCRRNLEIVQSIPVVESLSAPPIQSKWTSPIIWVSFGDSPRRSISAASLC